MSGLPYLERVRIQAGILLPLYRRLCSELGRERADALVRDAVREFATGLGRDAAAATAGTPLEQLRALVPAFTAGDALDLDMIRNDAGEMSFDVTRCAYAAYFQSIGEPEFGALLTCELDPPMTAAIGGGLTLERSETIMNGARRCDFRWRMKQRESSG